MNSEHATPIRYTGLLPLDGPGVVPLVWGKEKPTVPGWYWYKRFQRDGSPYSAGVVCIEEDRGEQLIIVSIGYVRDCEGEWAGPIPLPGPAPTLAAQHFYRVEEVEALLKIVEIDLCYISNSADDDSSIYWTAQRLLNRLRGMLKGWTRCSISFEHPPHEFCDGSPGALSPLDKIIAQEKGRTA